jgi:hypothetical protein
MRAHSPRGIQTPNFIVPTRPRVELGRIQMVQ